MLTAIVLYAFAWIVFAAVHSWLARIPVQQLLEQYLGRAYRFVYNMLALVQILAVYLFGQHLFSVQIFQFLDHSVIFVLVFIVQITGLLIIIAALRHYDLGRFSGITQLKTGEHLTRSKNEPLQRLGLNKWVRHPLYTGAFLVLWGGATTALGFWTAIWGSAYLVIGTLFEERKLTQIYGDEYRQYQQQVARYFPRFF